MRKKQVLLIFRIHIIYASAQKLTVRYLLMNEIDERRSPSNRHKNRHSTCNLIDYPFIVWCASRAFSFIFFTSHERVISCWNGLGVKGKSKAYPCRLLSRRPCLNEERHPPAADKSRKYSAKQERRAQRAGDGVKLRKAR